ncbi:MAG: 6-phosphofructokinase [Chloroflexi bacterium]|nr:6-phosphofructokinase [Chloroflexota bacterium]
MKIAHRYFTEVRVDALIFIGGRETQAAAQAFAQSGLPVNGIAASVENDVAGLEMIIGTDSALNIALDKIDYLRSTPTGHLLHLIEVAGRSSGYLALMSAVVGGAAAVILPETDGELVRNVANVAALTESGDPIIVAAEATDANRCAPRS